MQFDTITPLIDRFNNLIDSLIKDFKEFKLDEEAILFLAKKTRNFIGFTKLALLNIIFKILEKKEDVKYIFDDEIKIVRQIIDKLFENIEKSLDVILAHDHEEEGHSHHHEHEHIEVENIQDDINKIVDNLVFLKEILDDVCRIVISLLKYQSKSMSEEDFRTEYKTFKEAIKNYKKEYDTKFN